MTVVVTADYVWREARAVRARTLYRGVRSLAQDGVAEAVLLALNVAGPLLLGPCARPPRTRFLGADPRFAHVSSTLVRELAARGENVDHLVPHAIAARVLEAYGPPGR